MALWRLTTQQWVSRGGSPDDDGELNQGTKDNLEKFSHNLYGGLKVSLLGHVHC